MRVPALALSRRADPDATVTARTVEPGRIVLSSGHEADYSDRFRVETTIFPPSARVVATTLLAGSEAYGGAFARLVWKRTMGLDIRLGDPHTVAGWAVDTDRYDQFVLACGGRRTSGLMVFDTTSTTISWTTALVFHTPVAALLWRGLGPVHRALVPRQLTRLAARGA
jgi:hypothetical protein